MNTLHSVGCRLAALGILTMTFSGTGLAQSELSEKWSFKLGAYLNTVRVGVENELGQAAFPIKVNYGDDISGGIHFESGIKHFNGMFDISFISFADKARVGEGDQTQNASRFDVFNWELFGSYRFMPGPSHNFDFYIGMRYFKRKIEVNTGGPQIGVSSYDEAWLDPIVGVRYLKNFGSRFWLDLSGDIGGIDFGAMGTYYLKTGLGFRLTRAIDFVAAGHFLYTNRVVGRSEHGDTPPQFRYKGNEGKLLFGVNFNF